MSEERIICFKDLRPSVQANIVTKILSATGFCFTRWRLERAIKCSSISMKGQLLHSLKGPAIDLLMEEGSLTMYHTFGELHRTTGPAILIKQKNPRYFVHGLCVELHVFNDLTQNDPVLIALEVLQRIYDESDYSFPLADHKQLQKSIVHVRNTLRCYGIPYQKILSMMKSIKTTAGLL